MEERSVNALGENKTRQGLRFLPVLHVAQMLSIDAWQAELQSAVPVVSVAMLFTMPTQGKEPTSAVAETTGVIAVWQAVWVGVGVGVGTLHVPTTGGKAFRNMP